MGSTAKGLEIVVVAHTHWDREWYLPFQRFRALLVPLMDQVLEMLEAHPDFVFLLDGQTVILEDYLAVRPEREPEIKRFIKEGRLLVGPWYTQPDEFLVSGEALVRNLLWGVRQAEAFGKAMREGYVPDLFGHVAQLPQIFRGFGIGSAFLMRGVGERPERSEFVWEGLDGSTLWVHRFPAEYGNAVRLDDPGRLERLTRALRERATAPVVLWMHGTDHVAPQRDLLERLEALRARWPGWRLQLGTLTDYRERVQRHVDERELERWRGELRGSKHAFLLSGVLSARVYLKQQNDRAQRLLERYAEPLAGWAWVLGADYPEGLLREAWRLVLQNHAHDSICGCSVDETHLDVEARFRQAQQIAEAVVEEGAQALARRVRVRADGEGEEGSGRGVLVFNPHPWPWRGRVEALWPLQPGGAPQALQDEAGREAPVVITGETLRSVDVLNGVRHVPHARVAFYAEAPPLGYRLYRYRPVAPARGNPNPGPTLAAEADVRVRARVEPDGRAGTLENERLRVEVHPDGTFTLEDKRTKRRYERLHALVDEADRGDEYTFMPVAGDRPRLSTRDAAMRITAAEVCPDWATLRLELRWPLPAALTPDRRGRSDRTVEHTIEVELTLQRAVPRLDVRVRLENRARDHRLRAAFPLPGARQAWAETAFGVVARPAQGFVEEPPPGWKEAPSPTQPLLRFVCAQTPEGAGLAIATRGLHEYELAPDGTLYLTLLRGVGWLSRDDLSVRPDHAGPPYPTPEAQCLRPFEFEYALIPYSISIDAGRAEGPPAAVWREALTFHAPAWAEAVAPSGSEGGQLPPSGSLLRVEPEALVVSALKRAEDGDGLVLRVYNPTPQARRARLEFPLLAPEKVVLATLEERPQRPLELGDRGVEVELRPWEIITLKLVFPSCSRSHSRPRAEGAEG